MTETGLGVFFGEDEDDQFYDAESQVVSKQSYARPPNCAAGLSEPPYARGATGLIGLYNQGATCYMNSLFQILHLTPEFRQMIFNLPLCIESVDKSSEFLDSENKRKFLFALQKLFTEMQALNELYINTEQLTDAFGWHDNQQLVQQDIQELNNVLFDVIERALEGTQFFSQLVDYYKGQTVRKLKCTECGDVRSTPENFSSLTAYIQNSESTEQSLNQQFTTVEQMYGDNQISCELCGKKTDHEISHKVRKFPSILNVTLGRFIFDMEKLDRIKVNKMQTFPLQLNIAPYREVPEENQDKNIYELKAVIVHRGTAHGGHYFTYVRDELGEGDWNLKVPEKYEDEPVETVEQPSEEEKKKKEEEKKKKEDEKKEKMKAMEKELASGSTSKAQKKRLKKQIKEMEKQKEKLKEQNDTKPPQKNFNFQKCDFPIPYENKELRKGWFCLNDTSVFPVQLGVLQRQFGTPDENSESAYSLIYKQRALPKIDNVQIPPYFVQHMSERNGEMQKKRNTFYDLMGQLDVIIQPNSLFTIHSNVILKYEQDSMVEEQGIRVRLHFDDQLPKMREKVETEIKEKFGITQKLELYEVERMKSGYCHIIREFSKLEAEKVKEAQDIKEEVKDTVQELKEETKFEVEPERPLTLKSNYVTHFSTWLLLDPSSKSYEEMKQICESSVGKDNEPFDLKISYNDQETEFIYFRGATLAQFKTKVQEVTGLLPQQQKLSLVANAQMNRIDHKLYDNQGKEASLKYIGFPLKCVIFVEKRSTEEQMALQEAAKEIEKESEKPVDLEQLDTSIRSILLDFEEVTDNGPERFYVDMKSHTLKLLVQRCVEFMHVDMSKKENQGGWRLRRLVDKKLFYAEQLDTVLWDLSQDFREGGMRLKLERGNFPALDQYALNIGLYVPHQGIDVANSVDLIRKADSTIGELKREACLALGIAEAQIQEYKLYRVDAYEEPGQALRRQNLQLNSSNIDSGDCLCLKNKEELLYSEKIFIHLFHSETGDPDQDVLKVAEISVSKEITLADLKTQILQLEFYSQHSTLVRRADLQPVEMLRLRERAKTLAFGPILKGHDKTLKKLNVQQNVSLIAQILEEPEDLGMKTYKIFTALRDNEQRTYGKKIEVGFTYEGEMPIFPDLFKALTEPFMELLPQGQLFEIAKFIAYNFYWQHLNKAYLEAESMKQASKGKKKKKQKIDPSQHSIDKIDIRKMPVLLKDGDIFGVKVVDPQGEEEKELDFQTEEDALRRKQQEEMKELLKQNQSKKGEKGKEKKTEQAVVINAGF